MRPSKVILLALKLHQIRTLTQENLFTHLVSENLSQYTKVGRTGFSPKFRVISIMDFEYFELSTNLIVRGLMELERLEQQLEIVVKKNRKYFEKERVPEKKVKSVQELDTNSVLNRKREVFRQICQVQFDLTSFEFFNKLVDHAMTLSESELEQILK